MHFMIICTPYINSKILRSILAILPQSSEIQISCFCKIYLWVLRYFSQDSKDIIFRMKFSWIIFYFLVVIIVAVTADLNITTNTSVINTTDMDTTTNTVINTTLLDLMVIEEDRSIIEAIQRCSEGYQMLNGRCRKVL